MLTRLIELAAAEPAKCEPQTYPNGGCVSIANEHGANPALPIHRAGSQGRHKKFRRGARDD
jgi:hypothetical protein